MNEDMNINPLDQIRSGAVSDIRYVILASDFTANVLNQSQM